jgi:V8-like Glu-specific endopeptidase
MQIYGTVGASGSPIMTKDGMVIGVYSKGSADGSWMFASPIEERPISKTEAARPKLNQ